MYAILLFLPAFRTVAPLSLQATISGEQTRMDAND